MHKADASLALRPLRRTDFPLLARWLAEPLVARWWNHETAPAALERDFGPVADGRDAGEAFVVLAKDRPFGYLQRYPIAAYPDYAAELAAVCEVPPGALSIDYFIAVPELRGRGLGTAMIAAFVADSWSNYAGAADVIVPVAAGNVGSWRALERAGFRRIATGELEPDNPRDPRDHYVYRSRRPR